jgi:hypothetical protein
MAKNESGLNEQGGCAVGWTWIEGERIAAVTNSLDTLTIRFASGLVLEVQALLWKGKPFVSWKPHPTTS